nr:hypothetical protein [Sphingomonas jatrophae]
MIEAEPHMLLHHRHTDTQLRCDGAVVDAIDPRQDHGRTALHRELREGGLDDRYSLVADNVPLGRGIRARDMTCLVIFGDDRTHTISPHAIPDEVGRRRAQKRYRIAYIVAP